MPLSADFERKLGTSIDCDRFNKRVDKRWRSSQKCQQIWSFEDSLTTVRNNTALSDGATYFGMRRITTQEADPMDKGLVCGANPLDRVTLYVTGYTAETPGNIMTPPTLYFEFWAGMGTAMDVVARVTWTPGNLDAQPTLRGLLIEYTGPTFDSFEILARAEEPEITEDLRRSMQVSVGGYALLVGHSGPRRAETGSQGTVTYLAP